VNDTYSTYSDPAVRAAIRETIAATQTDTCADCGLDLDEHVCDRPEDDLDGIQ
jgi:hypothetical protein